MDAWDSTTSTRFCRRNLLFVTAGAAAIGGAGGSTAQSPATPSASPIEPTTIKRRGVGLRGHDPERAFAGFTLFSPLPSNNKTVYLIDMQGNVVHTWQMPYPPGQSGYLTHRGTLFYNGQIPNDSHVGRAPYRGGSALEMTWDGRILWEVKHPDHNHDGIRLRNGNVMLICQKPLPAGMAAKVQGGRPGTDYDNGKMDAPYLVEMTTDGRVVWEWRSWEHLDPEADRMTAGQDDRDVWTVGNGVSEMPDGNILLSFRAISTVVMIIARPGRFTGSSARHRSPASTRPICWRTAMSCCSTTARTGSTSHSRIPACSRSIRRPSRSSGSTRNPASPTSSARGYRTPSGCRMATR